MHSNTIISSVTTLKAPLDVTLSFVRYHLNIGIDHMFLYFDDPDDDAIMYLSENDRVTVISCDKEHWNNMGVNPNAEVQTKQEANATHALLLARQSRYEWIIHMDSDELIFGSMSIKEYFRQIPDHTEVIRFPVMEALPQKLKYNNAFKEIRHFKVYTALSSQVENFSTVAAEKKTQDSSSRLWHFKKRAAKVLGSKSAARERFLFGHTSGKSAMRTSAPIKKITCHLPIPENDTNPTLVVSKSFYVLHYDCMGYEKWKEKWRNRINGDHNFTNKRLSGFRVNLEKKIKKALKSEDQLKSFYRDLYSLSSYELYLLKSLGLIKKVKLSPELFDKPN